MYHEIAHLALQQKVGGPSPIWSNEGLAVFFEDLHRTKKGFDLQTIPWHRLWAMRRMLQGNAEGPPLETLVNLPQSGYNVNYYPQGWALIHFMLFAENGKYRRNFNKYYGLLESQAGRMSNAELFEKAFGNPPDYFQAAWVEHINSIKPESVQDFIGASRTAARFRMDLRQARDYADKAIELDPKNWQAHYALADALLLSGMVSNDAADTATLLKESIAAFEQAAEVGRFTTLRKTRKAGNYPLIEAHVAGPRRIFMRAIMKLR